MPSYDKEKLVRMLEQRRRAQVALRDLSDRRLDAKQQTASLRAAILHDAKGWAGHEVVNRLLKLSVAEAAKLSAAEIQEQAMSDGRIWKTGINVDNYRRFIALRDRAQRLDRECDNETRDFQARFGIVRQLIEAVQGWGFVNPEMEVL